MPDADILLPEYPAKLLANTNLFEVTEELLAVITTAVSDREKTGGEYEEIIFVGHSVGALLARKIYVYARGKREDSKLPGQANELRWAAKVSRIILIAGLNRGWAWHRKPEYMGRVKFVWMRFLSAIAPIFGVGKLIRSVRRGEPFVANLRLQWMALERKDPSKMPMTVQLLGSLDDVVKAEDNLDLQSGAKFIYLNVAGSGHYNIIHMDETTDGKRRAGRFSEALITPSDSLQSDNIPDMKQDGDVKLVAFVLHGIRDWGHWTADVSNKITKKAQAAGIKTVAVRSSYDFFSMISFLLRLMRRKNVRWFMDEYTEVVAKYPNARIGFVGHSNGTFILASTLERYVTTRFERIFLAGSVVPRTFPWGTFVSENRVSAICNALGSADWVVAIFPRFFELLAELSGRRSEIGSGGFLGFTNNAAQQFVFQYARGGHSAALAEGFHESIADFLVSGNMTQPPQELSTRKQSVIVSLLSKFCWLVWLVLIAAVLGLGYWLLLVYGLKGVIIFIIGFYLLLKTV